MANITNLEGNLEFELQLKKNDMVDWIPERSDYENWIPFTLYINQPNRCSVIEENVKAMMTVFETENMLHGIENVLTHLECGKSGSYTFNSSENFFELKLEVIPEDDVVEIELWINTGNQTNGIIFGFDEGVRFVTSESELNNFLSDLKRDYLSIKKQL